LICIKFAQEGANVAINYMSSEARAKDLAGKIEKEHGVKAIVIQGVSSTLPSISNVLSTSLSLQGLRDFRSLICSAVSVRKAKYMLTWQVGHGQRSRLHADS
jgi:NAD(P)-dependent dehydrogenase (short-subunit alcohol dehydrogenase family)